MLVRCGDVQLCIYLEAKLPLVDRLKQNDFVACDDIGSHRFAVDRQLWEESFDHGEIEILDSVSNDFAGGKVSDLGFGNRRKKRREEARDAFAQRRLNRRQRFRSEEHTSELQSLMRISYAVFCLKKKKIKR